MKFDLGCFLQILEDHHPSQLYLKASIFKFDFIQNQIKTFICSHTEFHNSLFVLQRSPVSSQYIHFLHRILQDLSIFVFQFPGNSQAVLPSFFDRTIGIFLICIRHSHPADQNPSSLSISESLGGIKVESHIPFPEVLHIYRTIFFHWKISRLIDILESVFLTPESLWGNRQDFLSVQFKIIRAFPHISEGFRCSKSSCKLPVLHIF